MSDAADFFMSLFGYTRCEPPPVEVRHWVQNDDGEFEIVNELLDGGDDEEKKD